MISSRSRPKRSRTRALCSRLLERRGGGRVSPMVTTMFDRLAAPRGGVLLLSAHPASQGNLAAALADYRAAGRAVRGRLARDGARVAGPIVRGRDDRSSLRRWARAHGDGRGPDPDRTWLHAERGDRRGPSCAARRDRDRGATLLPPAERAFMTQRSIVICDLGAVLINWNPRQFYRRPLAGDHEESGRSIAARSLGDRSNPSPR